MCVHGLTGAEKGSVEYQNFAGCHFLFKGICVLLPDWDHAPLSDEHTSPYPSAFLLLLSDLSSSIFQSLACLQVFTTRDQSINDLSQMNELQNNALVENSTNAAHSGFSCCSNKVHREGEQVTGQSSRAKTCRRLRSLHKCCNWTAPCPLCIAEAGVAEHQWLTWNARYGSVGCCDL